MVKIKNLNRPQKFLISIALDIIGIISSILGIFFTTPYSFLKGIFILNLYDDSMNYALANWAFQLIPLGYSQTIPLATTSFLIKEIILK